ncbi:MAG: GNAT family N-acetyltransferase [Variovorax sp.]
MITEYEITLAQGADALAISQLSRDAVEYGLSWRWTRERVLRNMRNASTNAVVARRGDDLLGFAIMKYGDDEAHIVLFAVQPGQRRSGLGSALLSWLEATAGVAGIRTIRLEARSGNLAARSFYGRHGFAEEGFAAGYYEGVEDAVRMVKVLGAEPTR